MFRPFTREWAEAFRDAINADSAYAAVAKGWIWPVAMVLEPEPQLGYNTAQGMQITIDRGTCTSAVMMAPHKVGATFVLRGSYDTWKSIMRGDLDAVAAVTRGELKLTGPLTTLLLHAKAASAMIAAARSVPTAFPDEAE